VKISASRTLVVIAGIFFAMGGAHAAWTSSISGVVTEIRFHTPDVGGAPTIMFAISNMPSTGCSNNNSFALSPANVSDPQMMRTFIAALMTARVSGQPVTVGYDSGASCDPSGMPRIYSIVL